MAMDKQISNTRKMCYHHLRNLYQIKDLLSTEKLKTLVHAYITSRIDFCNSLLVGSTQKQLSRLQVLHNSSARMLTNTSKYDSISPILYQLHWLPIKFRILFKVLTMAHKFIYGINTPSYINLQIKKPQRVTRAASYAELSCPETPRLKSVGYKSLYFSIATEWNKLPGYMRNEHSFNMFKTALKTHLFELAF